MKSIDSLKTGEHIVKTLFNARKYAYICSPYIDEKYANAILDLAEKGCIVKVIASSDDLFYFFRDYSRRLRNFRYNITPDNSPIVHSKMYIADDTLGIEGSTNLTYNGLWQQMNTIHICENIGEVSALRLRFENLYSSIFD